MPAGGAPVVTVNVAVPIAPVWTSVTGEYGTFITAAGSVAGSIDIAWQATLIGTDSVWPSNVARREAVPGAAAVNTSVALPATVSDDAVAKAPCVGGPASENATLFPSR